ncbi:FAD/NAD(P)-binding domain-containing protein [Hysterangium stoloniferum]|nr:FAD/NAD(P)-binding domain-containing protein [Hysterangium stoloniferum]
MKVAIVGSGVSGLAAAWALNEFGDHEVHLYEADARPGGHANTVLFTRPNKDKSSSVNVDTCIVLNPSTYPNFLRFLKLKGVPVVPTEMTFSVSRNAGAFEWAGKNLFTVFCQIENLMQPFMWRMIWDILRFNASARKLLLSQTEDPSISIGTYLQREGYSDSFRDNYLIPMTAAIWSTPPGLCATDFPARTLIQFMNNHHLLQVSGKPSWLTIEGGSRLYVERIISRLPARQLHLSTPIVAVKTTHNSSKPSVLLTSASGDTVAYDHVIMACHSNMTLQLLEKGGYVSPEEKNILGSFGWSTNEAILHSDTALMPRRRRAWSCWNYLTSSTNENGQLKANSDHLALTYYMNDLQHISEEKHGPVLVSLNPSFEPRPETVIGRYKYEHPVMDSRAWSAQHALPSIQNTRGISYAGAWTAFGFHEDGFTSGLRAATASPLSAKVPFGIRYPNRSPGSLWPAYIFDLVEFSGIRRLLAFILVAALNLAGRAITAIHTPKAKRA